MEIAQLIKATVFALTESYLILRTCSTDLCILPESRQVVQDDGLVLHSLDADLKYVNVCYKIGYSLFFQEDDKISLINHCNK